MDIKAFLASLPIMGMGMAGIFIVILAIMLALKLMIKFFPEKKEEEE